MLKMLLASLNLIQFDERLRSLIAKNFGSVGQRTTKLLAVKVGGLKKKSAASAITAEVCASTSAQVRVQPGLNHSQSLTDGNFVTL